MREKNNGALIMVCDTGIGIADYELPHIFDRFYRASKDRSSSTGGAGLGLPIARYLVERHSGHIEVQSVVSERGRHLQRLSSCWANANPSLIGSSECARILLFKENIIVKIVAIAVLGLAWTLNSRGAEVKVALNELPEAVRTSAKQQSKGAKILGASKESEHGRMTYEVETSLNGKSRDLTFDEQGALLEVEEQVDLDSIPPAGKAAILKRAAHGTVKRVESVTRGSVTTYEADIKQDGKTKEIGVTADGSPTSQD